MVVDAVVGSPIDVMLMLLIDGSSLVGSLVVGPALVSVVVSAPLGPSPACSGEKHAAVPQASDSQAIVGRMSE